MKKDNLQEEIKMKVPFEGKFFSGVGRRKEAVAQVRLYSVKTGEKPQVIVNGRAFEEYFKNPLIQDFILYPLKVTGLENKFHVSIKVDGGGKKGQSEAVRLGIARAILKFDNVFRSTLRKEGLLTRDSRVVERKKYGLHKARRAHQFRKR